MAIKTYPEMNKKIVGYLRDSEINFAIYAAKRIEELEATSRELSCALQAVLDGNPHDNYEDWKRVGDQALEAVAKAKGVLGDE